MTYNSDEEIYQGLRSGAKGYSLKDAEPEELLSAIRTVHKGQKHIPPQVGAKLLERMASPELSDRELEVLQLITTGKSTQAISKALHIAERTVNFHINNILSKLSIEDCTWLTDKSARKHIPPSGQVLPKRKLQTTHEFAKPALTEIRQSIRDRTQAVVVALRRGIVNL